MKEQLENAVVQILERAISGIDSSIEFMQSELPDVIEQLLVWYLVKGLMTVAIGLLLIMPLITLTRLYLKQDIKSAKEDSFWVNHCSYGGNTMGAGVFAAFAFTGFFALRGLIMFFSSLFKVVKIWIAPKIWLMEYAASLVK